MTEPANREGPASSRTSREGLAGSGSLIHAATHLPWLAPAGASLTVLACPPANPWPHVRHDPGAVLLLLRSSPQDGSQPFSAGLFTVEHPLRIALSLLNRDGFHVNWYEPRVRPIYDSCLTLARIASHLARKCGKADPDQAWCAGMLAPLGWLALAAIAPGRVANTLLDTGFGRDPLGTAERLLGADPVIVARRLARSWELPGWLAGILAHIELPLDHARRFGVDPILFSLTRITLQIARQQGVELGLRGCGELDAEESLLGVKVAAFDAGEMREEMTSPATWDDPHTQPLLRELLGLAIENRRLRDTPRLARLETEVDSLHLVLGEQVRGESDRLRAAKLSGLAEFAAGASHEINNPLAVISGHTQYILGHESDWLAGDEEGEARKSLHTIIHQTRRIHAILRDLMQFARPAPPRPSWIDLPTLLGEVAASLEEVAAPRRVRVEVNTRPERFSVLIDPEQIRSALTCLLRNAIEAAPVEGWARLVLSEPGPVDRVEVFIEDSGNGPSIEQRPHLFDPFYSGRSAGRGRGLGLPLAWRLARQQGGDVSLEPPHPGQPTRFILALPRHSHPTGANAA